MKCIHELETNKYRELPESRLAELFNVNHFIVSQATPYIAPFLARGPQNRSSSGIIGKFKSVLSLELKHRMHQVIVYIQFTLQLADMKLIPRSLLRLVDQKVQAGITIAPPLTSIDFYTLFSSPTASSMHYWILKGEQATWPFLSLIKSRTVIELALENGKRFAFAIYSSWKQN